MCGYLEAICNNMLGILGLYITEIKAAAAALMGTTWIQKGSDIDGEAAGDYFGWGVSLNASGDTLAIGGYSNDGNGSNSGHVRIYSWNGSSWVQLGSDIDGEAAGDYSGYSVSLNGSGDRVAIGGYNNDGNGSNSGHVRIYSWNGSSWVQLGSDIDGEAAGDNSGYSVSLNASGDTLAIGGYNNDGNGSSSGHVRIYSWNGSSWVQLGSDIDGEAAGDYSGYSVSINADGDRVAIGANNNDGNGSNSGHIRIYSWNGSSWVQLGSDIDGEAAGNGSGYSVSLNADGDRVAIGAPYNGTGGHVRIYSWNGSSWVQLGSDIDTAATYSQSGWSVSLNNTGDLVAIGSPQSIQAAGPGFVKVYQWNGTSWIQIGLDITGEASLDRLGAFVSLNYVGDSLAIGAPYNDANGSSSGHVRVYNLV